MNYFRNTTDASDLYRPTSAAAGTTIDDTADRGNMADMMRYGTLYKATFIVPRVIQQNPGLFDTNSSPTSGPVW
jgi:hypothetical protein